MTSSVFKKSIFISLLGHLTVFSIFSFSFGNSIPKAQYVCVSFWGQFLHNSQVTQPVVTSAGLKANRFFSQPALGYYFPAKAGSRPILSDWRENPTRNTTQINNNVIVSNGVKPPLTLTFNSEKEIFIKNSPDQLFSSRKSKPSIIVHPLLPYGFTLYFKDRQVAHVELMYKIVSFGLKNSIVIKRKISSGNLEVDLLVMRYIGHYLFIQPGILANNWQTVKIDLSAKND